jgi:glycosyltransferase involved in cell wall biosynthesis
MAHIVIDARIRRSSTGRYADRLIEHLQMIDTKNRYTILVQTDDPWKPSPAGAGNFAALPCPFPQFSMNLLNEVRFAHFLRRLHPDLVHFNMTQQPLLYFGRIVTTTHDTTMFHFIRRGTTPLPIYKIKMWLYHFLVWWSHRKSSKIIVPTQTVAREIAQLQPFTKNKLVVTYEASEPPLATPAKQPWEVHKPFLLYVGTAFPHKNLPKLIDAFDILHTNYPDFQLVLAGKREKHYDELATWAEAHPSFKNIVFTGFVSDAELKWLYQECEAYIFASLSEGFGLPPLEAMAHGAPVISSNASVMPEVYGPAAHYFDAQNPRAIAAAVDEVLANPKLRQQLIEAGYKQLKKYSWRKMAQQTLAVYQSTLDD